jgi:hypothetical protein
MGIMNRRVGGSITNTVFLLFGWVFISVLAQDEVVFLDVQIWNSQFLNKRPEGKKGTQFGTAKYKRLTKAPTLEPITDRNLGVVGLTLWRLGTVSTTKGPILLAATPKVVRMPPSFPVGISVLSGGAVKKGEGAVENNRIRVPIQIPFQTRLSDGDRIILTVEPSHPGYVYVVEREQHGDGSLGKPYLVFPSASNLRQEYEAAPGQPVQVPYSKGREAFLEIRARPMVTAAILSLLISPEPIKELGMGAHAEIPESVFSGFRSRWLSTSSEVYELEDQTPAKWTKAVQSAVDRLLRLSQDESIPQTIHVVEFRRGEPVMIDVQLLVQQKDGKPGSKL